MCLGPSCLAVVFQNSWLVRICAMSVSFKTANLFDPRQLNTSITARVWCSCIICMVTRHGTPHTARAIFRRAPPPTLDAQSCHHLSLGIQISFVSLVTIFQGRWGHSCFRHILCTYVFTD